MKKHFGTAPKALTMLTLIALLSACGATGSPQQRAEANAVNLFDENRAPYGQRIALAEAGFKPRLYGLNPYFGR